MTDQTEHEPLVPDYDEDIGVTLLTIVALRAGREIRITDEAIDNFPADLVRLRIWHDNGTREWVLKVESVEQVPDPAGGA